MARIYREVRRNQAAILKESGAKSPYKARAFRDICVVASAWADRLVE